MWTKGGIQLKGIEDWEEAKETYERGQMIRLMLGNSKWLEGLWSGDSIMVAESSPNLRHEIKKDDLVTYDGKHGFIRVRLDSRNVTISTRSWFLLALDALVISDEEE